MERCSDPPSNIILKEMIFKKLKNIQEEKCGTILWNTYKDANTNTTHYTIQNTNINAKDITNIKYKCNIEIKIQMLMRIQYAM
jgi:hypothetical protein